METERAGMHRTTVQYSQHKEHAAVPGLPQERAALSGTSGKDTSFLGMPGNGAALLRM